MTASPEATAAFFAWAAAELSAHRAAPCSNEVMDMLTERSSDRLRELCKLPASSAEDVVLKLFPTFLSEHEPKLGDPPLHPVCSFSSGVWRDVFDATVADMARVCPEIAAVMTLPSTTFEKDLAA